MNFRKDAKFLMNVFLWWIDQHFNNAAKYLSAKSQSRVPSLTPSVHDASVVRELRTRPLRKEVVSEAKPRETTMCMIYRENKKNEGSRNSTVLLVEPFPSRASQKSLELSPFAVKAMFWFCVNQSDCRIPYTYFWLWSELMECQTSHQPQNTLNRHSNFVTVDTVQFNSWDHLAAYKHLHLCNKRKQLIFAIRVH